MDDIILELKKDATSGTFYKFSIGVFKFWFVQESNGDIYSVNISDYSGKYDDFELYIDIDDCTYYPARFSVRTHTRKQNVSEAMNHIEDMKYICSVLISIEQFFNDTFRKQ